MPLSKILLMLLPLAATLALAQEPSGPAPLTFQTWKHQQILESQNQVLRISARMNALKNSKSTGAKVQPAHLANGKLKLVSDTDTLAAAEQDMKRAQESLADANALQFDDYVDVYIPSLSDQPEALQKLADRLSKEELADIFKGLMRRNTLADAKRNAALMEGLGSSAASKTP